MLDASDAVREVADRLATGGLAVVATDTVYGLVARPDSAAALERIYALKERPRSMPLALLAGDTETLLRSLAQPELRIERIIRTLLPGPYTLVVAASTPALAALGGGPTVGVRVPRLPRRAAALIAMAGPLASTSANRHGGLDPASVEALDAALASAVDGILDDGELPGTPSTVVDVTESAPRILREGAVSELDTLRALEAIAP